MMTLREIAIFHSPFATKFGIPKQSGLASRLEGCIVFCPQWRNAELIRGLEEYDFLWLLWGFSGNRKALSGTTVRPPLLGGNVRMGVLATRSPFRPNPIGLSSVRLSHIDHKAQDAPVIHVTGADLMDGTPIYDIKPYLPYTDAHPTAAAGFTDKVDTLHLEVDFAPEVLPMLSINEREMLIEVLSLDPRPRYHQDVNRIYAMEWMGGEVRFRWDGEQTLTVVQVIK